MRRAEAGSSGEADRSSGEVDRSSGEGEKRYKGVRRRKWGKWVSEIRVPNTQERLWLGSYSTPEAAAVAHDTAVFLLRGPSSSESLNFPGRVSSVAWASLSPTSIQKVASDSAMAVDATFIAHQSETVREPPEGLEMPTWEEGGGGGYKIYGRNHELRGGETLDISIDDMEIYL